MSRSERSQPATDFLDERSRSQDAHSLARTEVSDVVRHEDASPCPDRGRQDRDVLRIGKFARPFTVVRCRAVDLDWNRAEELLEERRGFRELGGQIPSNLRHGGLGQHHTKEAKLAENQDRVAGTRAGQEPGDQDISIDTNK